MVCTLRNYNPNHIILKNKNGEASEGDFLVINLWEIYGEWNWKFYDPSIS